MKWPSKKQWSQIFRILTKKEKIALSIFFVLFLGSLISLTNLIYFKNTKIGPKVGGIYREGVVGSPRFINPIYAQSSDVDRDLVEIIFSGLMKYQEDGKIIPDLAQKVEIKDEGRTYEVYLKKNIFWHDGQKLTADDVIFTIKTIQNPDYKSPLRANYLGVKMEKINDLALRFKLENPYSGFLERLTLKIIPKHIWQNISPQNFLLTNYNLKPVGSGPYQFKKLTQDKSGRITSLNLTRFRKYYINSRPQKPYLSEIEFRFFETEEDLIDAAKKGEIDGFSFTAPDYWETFPESDFQKFSLSLPRYFAVFFNPEKSKFLADENVRKALNYATNKAEIIKKVFKGRAKIVSSPVLPEIYGYKIPTKTSFNFARVVLLTIPVPFVYPQGFKISSEYFS